MAKSNGAAPHRPDLTTAGWAELRAAAYRNAEEEIALLRPGEAVLYHEGNLARDIGSDPIVAGRAAAFRDATEAAKGWVAHQYIFWRTGP